MLFCALKSIKILMARQVYFIVKPIIASLIVVLNVIEIGLLVKHFKRHKATTVCRHAIPIILMADLALSDLLVGVAFVIDICINELIRKKIISINRTNLQILVLFRVVSLDLSMFASCFKTILLTLDRLFAVRFPLAYRSRARNKHAFVLALITWVLSAALIFVPLPIILFNNSIDSFWYHIISIATTVLVATFTLLVCNVMIVKSVRKQGRGLRGIANNSGCYSRKRKSHVNMTPTQSSSDKVGFEHTTVIVRNSDNSIRPLHIVKRELKVFRLPLTLVIAFIVCWLPIALYNLIFAIDKGFNFNVRRTVFLFAISNSAINPLIYLCIGAKKSLLFCICKNHCFLSGRKRPVNDEKPCSSKASDAT
ncbi:alpha-1A adrenergic receptor-like [Rhopilema esculentum]|uniref:alpha-1A adrenergic receptor-like n=1 Tax=Rhopilema esculentum TaxID=499914 RepID=UPI0031DB93DB